MAVVATGFFDGVHLGHRQVIQTLVSSAREKGEEAIVVTFSRHPRTVLQQDARDLRLLNSPEEKVALLHGLGVDRVETLVFDRAFARLTAAEYIRDMLVGRFGATTLVLGYDNRLGSDRLTPDRLTPIAESLGLTVVVVPPASAAPLRSSALRPATQPRGESQESDNFAKSQNSPISSDPTTDVVPPLPCRGRQAPAGAAFSPQSAAAVSTAPAEVVSSTKIRKALEEGRVEEAEAMLGYAYRLRGLVVGGKQLGRTIGFPTANLRLYDPMKLVPGRGVYLTEVEVLGGHYWGMTNVGDIIETHIFEFDEDIYGHDLEIRFRRYLRPMRTMDSLAALKVQLHEDEARCRELLESLTFNK